MPSSWTGFKSNIQDWIINNVPTNKRVLDVGPGVGTYSDLLRHKGYQIDAVEIFRPYIEKYGLIEKYDNVYCDDIVKFDISDYDFIILGDVLEHLPAERAKELDR
jgi:2-polyprenyl-3-methyl-5-hydroxy-6-metoxy-1,4-benzoquinol methylase